MKMSEIECGPLPDMACIEKLADSLSPVGQLLVGLLFLVLGLGLILLVVQCVAGWFGKTWLVDQLRMMMLVLLGVSAVSFGLYFAYGAFIVVFG